MIELALSQEEQQRRAAGLPIQKQQMMPISAAPAQQGPLSQMTDMAKQKLMTSAVNKGAEMATAKGAEMMAANSALAGVGTAMPYIGAGLLAGKALGFFNEGGAVERENTTMSGMPRDKSNYGFREFLDDYGLRSNLFRLIYGHDENKPKIPKGMMEAGKSFKGFPVQDRYSVTKESGGLIGPLALRKIRYKQDGGKVEIEATMGE